MTRALRLAQRGLGRVEPNPMVGAVIVKNGTVLAEGWHRRFGGPHAEVEALRKCTRPPRGATVYTTLEPCCHFGKTPPCADALIAAGVRRVVAALPDPSPQVNGQGFARLRAAGIRVDVGLCAAEAAELAAPFLTRVRCGRPYVILKWAQSLDGKLATSGRQSRWISGEVSRRDVHRLRAVCDAVLVGIQTVLADDPRLTARDVAVRRIATRVVLDTRLRMPEQSCLVRSAATTPTLVFSSRTAVESAPRRVGRLARHGVQVEAARVRGGRIDLNDALHRLAAKGMSRVLVEGGGGVLTSFLDAGLADEALVFVAPRLIGGADAPAPWSGRGLADVARDTGARVVSIRRRGPDVCFRLRLSPPLIG